MNNKIIEVKRICGPVVDGAEYAPIQEHNVDTKRIRDLYNKSWNKSHRIAQMTNQAFGYMARDFRRTPIHAWKAILSPMTLLWLMMPFAVIVTIDILT